MPFLFRLIPVCLIAAVAGAAHAQAPTRGELLYTTHCKLCHTEQMHWRAQNKARDWDSLKAWVRHWQGEAKLQWSEEDINEVARYLNDTIYGFPRPVARR